MAEKPNNAPSYEDLMAMDKRRKIAGKHSYEHFLQVLTHIDGTVLTAIVIDPFFWLNIATYVIVRVVVSTENVNAPMSGSDLAVIGGFLTFFLVFYVNQNFSRYYSLWSMIMVAQGRLFDVGIMLGNILPPDRAHRIMRYMNMAHAAGYTGLSDVYETENFIVPLVKATGMLTDEEMARLKKVDIDSGGAASRELFSWTLADVTAAKREGLIDELEAYQIRLKVMETRGQIGGMYEAIMMPVPFFYSHFICLLTFIYLPLFSIASAYDALIRNEIGSDIIIGLVVCLQCVFLIGLRLLGERMSDPFGDDLVDFPVLAVVLDGWKSSMRATESAIIEQPPSNDHEQKLKDSRELTLGDAWKHTVRPEVSITKSPAA